jgi:hypothetical protein
VPTLWPFRPVPASTEALSWETDIMATPASERRVSLRAARQTVSYSYILSDHETAEAEWLVRENPLGEWFVPLWFEATPAQPIAAADTVLAVDTEAHYFAGGSLVVWAGCDAATVCEIASVGSGTVTVTSPVGNTYAKAIIMPLRTAWLDGGLRVSRIRERGLSDVAVTFQVTDDDAPAATPYAQYLGLDLVLKCGVVEPLAGSLVPVFDTVDNGSGPVSLEPRNEYIASRHSMSWRLKANLWERRRWMHHIRGRDRAFWLADWQKDLTLAAPITSEGATITVRKIAPVAASLIGRHLLVDDGTKTAREITNAVTSGTNQVLTVTPIGRNISAARIGLLRKVRFDADVIELAHQHWFYTAARIPLVEVPE